MEIGKAKVLITGANSGIGYAAAKALKEQGAQVVICGRDEDKVKAASESLGVQGFKADVSREKEVIDLMRSAIDHMGGMNVLINNAGVGGKFASLTDLSVEDLQSVWEINVKGLFTAGREAARHFKEQHYGNIINIGSTAALKGFANGSAYVASKFAVSGLTECWRAELRPHNVRVMQVNPSEVITEFATKAGFEYTDNGKKLKPQDIAHVMVSMLSMNDVGFVPDASVWATNPW